MSIATNDQRIQIKRPPITPDELHAFVQTFWGVTIPRMKVCADHDAPFDAFCEGYFGNSTNWVLWYGSRGTGKSLMLALLALTKAAALGDQRGPPGWVDGPEQQRPRARRRTCSMHPNAPTYTIERQIKTELTFHAGNWVRPIPASQKTVRGPHPQMTLLDEIDEMERAIYDAAMGQALEKVNQRGYMLQEMVVASSQRGRTLWARSHQSGMRPCIKGQPVRTWCWREVLKTETNPEGWMDPEFIERKKQSVPAEMFRVEYELGEPAGDARAFDLTKLDRGLRCDGASRRDPQGQR